MKDSYKVHCYYETTLIKTMPVTADSLAEAEQIARKEFEERSKEWESFGGFPQTLIKVEVDDFR